MDARLNIRIILAALVCLGAVKSFSQVLPPAAEAQGLTLEQAYAAALRQSEQVAISEQTVQEARGTIRQALGTALPRVSLDATYTWQHLKPGSTTSSSFVSSGWQSNLALNQTLFSGFREFAALKAGRLELRQFQENTLRSRQTLLATVADAYYTLLLQRETIALELQVDSVVQATITELNHRERVGRSRRSEVVSTEVLLYQNQAGLELARSQETDARKALEFLTGIRPITTLYSADSTAPDIKDEQYYLALVETRPDVQAARYAKGVAQQSIAVSRAEFWPTLSFNADYYLRRTGFLRGINWDAGLTLSVPILPLVGTAGAVQTARARAREADLSYRLSQRNAVTEIRTVWEDLTAALDRHHIFEQAMASAQENLRLQKQDYANNLITNLDVLTAVQSLLSTRLAHLQETYRIVQLYWHLRVAAGEVP